MALFMSLILGSGLAAFTSNSAFAQNYGYQTTTTIHTTTAIQAHRMGIVVIAHTQQTINHMSVEQVHLKAFLYLQ